VTGYTVLRYATGASACVDERPGTGLACLSIRIAGGSGDDPPGRSGLAHLFEHLLVTGTPSVGRDRYLSVVQDCGAQFRATTGASWTTFSTLCAADALPEILRLETDRFATTIGFLTEPVVEREKQVVRRERAQRVDTAPYGDALERLFPMLYGRSGYGRIPVGIDAEVAAITLGDCVDHFRTGYAGGRIAVALSGDVVTGEVADSLAALMGVLPPGDGRAGDGGTVTPETVSAEVPTTLPPKLYLGFRLPPADEAAFDQARLGAYLLGKGDGSLLRRSLMHTEPAVLSDVQVKTLTRLGVPSAGIVEAVPAEGVPVATARAEVRRVLGEVAAGPVDDADADRARADFRRSWHRDDDAIRGRADGLSLALLRSGDPARYDRELDAAASARPDLIRAAVGWWAPDRVVCEVVYA
jgi:predicted Zn-dependent peptidase